MTKKILSALLALLIICSFLPSLAFAENFDAETHATIPYYLNGMVESNWDSTTSTFTVMAKDTLDQRGMAYLYQNCHNRNYTRFVVYTTTKMPEGTEKCILGGPSNGYTFEDFQKEFSQYTDLSNDERGFEFYSLDGEKEFTSSVPIATLTVTDLYVNIGPRNSNIEEYYAWFDEDGNSLGYSIIKTNVVAQFSEVNISKEKLESEKFSEHRNLLDERGFFDYWTDEELISSFEKNSNGISVETIYPGDADFSDSITCEFVDGILEIKLHEMTPELLKKAYDIFSDTQGKLCLNFKIILPEGTLGAKREQGNGPIFQNVREVIDGMSEMNEGETESRFNITIGRFVKDGNMVTFMPEEGYDFFFGFVGYYGSDNEIHQCAIATYVTLASDAKAVSFENPRDISFVKTSQIEVDDTYEKIVGRDTSETLYGAAGYNPYYDEEKGQLTYKYLGTEETPEDIANELKIPNNGNIKTTTRIHAPEGYILDKVYDGRDGNCIRENVSGDDNVTWVHCVFGRDGNIENRNNYYIFAWKNTENQSILYQKIYITNDFGKPFSFFDYYWEVPESDRIRLYSDKLGIVTVEDLAKYGIHVDINYETGFVYTTFDENARLDLVGDCRAYILPPAGATRYKANNSGGMVDIPAQYNKGYADDMVNYLNSVSFEPLFDEIDYDHMYNFPIVISDTAKIGDLTVWYPKFITTENFVIDWYNDSNDGPIERNYLYGTMEDYSFVQETNAIVESDINDSVEYPTIIKSNGDSRNWQLKSKKNPQNGNNKMLIELKALWENNPEELKCIFIPRDYINYDGNWEKEEVTFTIVHYEGIENLSELEEAASRGPGVPVEVVFNENGLYIYTNSFSPFMINWEPKEKNIPEDKNTNTVVISIGQTMEEVPSDEANPNTGAVNYVGIIMAIAVIASAGIILGKKR